MKLRNKKTGKVVEAYKEEPIDLFIYLGTDEEGDELNRKTYCSITELNEEWEGYNPAEPYIKATDVRHILKQWARTNLIPYNSNEIEVCLIDSPKGTITQFYSDGLYIQFFGRVAPDAISGRCYTIDELCGEEE